MKNKLMFVFLLVFTFSSFVIKQENENGIQFFEGSFKDALKKAQAENKFIFLDAYATWCGPCRMMSKSVFPDEKLGKFYNANFINMKVDMDSEEGKEVARLFPVKAYPTLIYINPSGNEIYRILGLQKSERLINIGKQVLKK